MNERAQQQRDKAAAHAPGPGAAVAGPRQAELTDTAARLNAGQRVQQLAAMASATTDAARPNRTGLPDALKAGVELLSGMAMDHVRVHYNSAKPAQLNAFAYAQGNDIHLGPGQEKHLAHEAWHVVQQCKGRVRPTMRIAGEVAINDDPRLEREADVMGGKAAVHLVSAPLRHSRIGLFESVNGVTPCQLSAEDELAQMRVNSVTNGMPIFQFAPFTAFSGMMGRFAKRFGQSIIAGTKPPFWAAGDYKGYLDASKDEEATSPIQHEGGPTIYSTNPAGMPQTPYPPENGFANGSYDFKVGVGTKLGRFGSPNGEYLANAGTSFEKLSLPHAKYFDTYTTYIVIKPFWVRKGAIAPWFSMVGGGIQYKTSDSVVKLIADGFLKESDD